MGLPWPFNEIWNFINQVWNWVLGEFNWIWGAINDWFWKAYWATHDWIRDWTWARAKDLEGWINGTIEWARDNLEGWIKGVGNAVGDVWDWIQTGVQTTVDNLGKVVWAAADLVGDGLDYVRTNLGNLIGGLMGEMGDFIGLQMGNLGSSIGEVLGNIGELWDQYNRIVYDMQMAEVQRENAVAVTTTNILQSGAAAVNLMTAFVQENLINPLETYLASIPVEIAAFFTDLFTNLWTTIQGWAAAAFAWFSDTAWPELENMVGGLRDWLHGQAVNFADTLLGAVTGGSPATPDSAMPRVRDLFAIGATSVGGLAAMSVGAELMHPLKQIGLGRISAMIWDATGYRTIIGNVMNVLVSANIGTPLRYWANREFRPWIMDRQDLMQLRRLNRIGESVFWEAMTYHGYSDEWQPHFEALAHTVPPMIDLSMMFAKKEIDTATFDDWMGLHGLEQKYLDVYHRHIWLDPRLTEMIRIAQFYRPPETPDPEAQAWLNRAGIEPTDWADWWWWYKIAKAGYERIDIPVLVNVAKIAVARREQTLYFDAARRLRRDGYIDDGELQELVADGWRPRAPVEFRADATALDVQYDVIHDTKTIVMAAYTRKVVSESETMEMLSDLGMEPLRIQLELARAKVGLLPRARLMLASEAEEPIQ